jgi:integrase
MSCRKPVPSYRLHKQSGQAIVTLPDGQGGRHDVLLGPHDTPESRQEYARVLAEWEANGRRPPASAEGSAPDVTVNEVILPYWQHVEGYYRHADGSQTSEVYNIKLALRPLKKLYGHTRAADFDSLALEAVRTQMVRDGHCRKRVNKDVARIKRLFRWAAGRKLVPLAVHQSLQTVEGLHAGRSDARETPKVKPVADKPVEATLPHLRPQVAAMVRLQRLTGMRPGEVVILRGLDLEMTGKVWVYRPGSDQGRHGAHKTAYRGQDRTVLIGPKGQEVLRPWLRLQLGDYLFQPREAMAAYRAEQRRNRKSKVQPSQEYRKKAKPKKVPGQRYTSRSYAQAIAKAAQSARGRRAAELYRGQSLTIRQAFRQATEEIPHWHPNQLRHSLATELRPHGLDVTKTILGHTQVETTQVYAEKDLAAAMELVARIG